MINKQQLKEIIKDLIEVCKEQKLTVENNSEYLLPVGFEFVDMKTIFEQACQYQRGLMVDESRKVENKITPMTDKQRNLINKNEKKFRKMGFDIDNIQTKQEASKIIKEFIQMQKKDGDKSMQRL